MEKFLFINEPFNSTLYVRGSDIISIRSYEKFGNYTVKIYIKGMVEPSTVTFPDAEKCEDFIDSLLDQIHYGE